jgi:hypothetical protein
MRTTAGNFRHTFETVEAIVNFEILVIANEDGSCRLCEIQLPNQEVAAGRLCIALLTPKHVDKLISTLTAWKASP